jgi:hypothetical protein
MPKPKVISVFKTDKFESRFLNVPMMGKPVDFFIECKSYDLEIPVNGKSKKELDIFEETVLRMVELKKSSIDELADVLCLKKDLVNFILIRLTESGLLENNQTLSEKGKQLLDTQTKVREEVEMIQGKLFIIKKTGLVLPYIHIGEFQSESVDDFDSSSITLGYGSAGNYHKIRGKCLRNSDYEKRMDSILDTRIVRKSIKTFNKIASAKNMSAINLCEEYGMSSSASENIYFHLQAVVQEGNVDEVMFSDGFVSNIDGVMHFVRQENPDLLSDIKSRAVDMTISVSGDEKKTYKSHKYQEIYQLYENAYSHLPSMEYEEATIDERKDINEGKKQIIIDCYYMIEWGFYYYTLKNRLSEAMLELIKQRSFSANAKTFTQFANNIGIQYSNMCSNLFSHVDGNKIHGVYNYHSPKLYVCLPLAIAEAKENSNSDIHMLVQKDRGFLRFINYLNENCGDLRHDSDADAIEMNAAEILQETKRILCIILPDLSFGEEAIEKGTGNDISQARLLGQVSLEKKLGSIYFSAMSTGLKNEWIKISPDKKGNQLPDSREYIEILYRILQAELAEANSELKGKHRLSKIDALALLGQRYKGRAPKSFSKVGEGYYTKSSRGEKSTLGAEALVYIANVEEAKVDKLNELHYVTVLDRVISLRGHVNMVALNENEQSLNSLRDEVIKLSRVIGGYYD